MTTDMNRTTVDPYHEMNNILTAIVQDARPAMAIDESTSEHVAHIINAAASHVIHRQALPSEIARICKAELDAVNSTQITALSSGLADFIKRFKRERLDGLRESVCELPTFPALSKALDPLTRPLPHCSASKQH
jgi:hypothetical protein